MQTEKHIVLIYCHMYIYHRQCHCHHYKRYHNHNVHHHHSHLDSLNAVSCPLYFHHFCKKVICDALDHPLSFPNSLHWPFANQHFLSSNIYMCGSGSLTNIIPPCCFNLPPFPMGNPHAVVVTSWDSFLSSPFKSPPFHNDQIVRG